MGYSVKYINCKICGCDFPRFLGLRGNLEYDGAPVLQAEQEHMVTNVVRCRKCGFVYTNPLVVIAPEERGRFYSQPDKYRSSVSDAQPLKVFNRSLDILERFTGRRRGRLLDVGAGKGEFLAAAKIQGWEAYGIEPSKDFVSYAKDKYAVDIRHCPELGKAGFPENYFDALTLNMVLEHVDEPSKLMSEVNRLLKKGGLLYIEVPNTASLFLKLIKIYYILKGRQWSPLLSPLHYPYHCYGYNKSCLKLLCDSNGFDIKKIIISAIGLRGLRPHARLSRFKKAAINLVTDIFGCINQGDILIVVGVKR